MADEEHEYPIEILCFDDDRDVFIARREGEPSFVWVQDTGDAFQAAQSRGVDLVFPRTLWEELIAEGAVPSFGLSNVRVID